MNEKSSRIIVLLIILFALGILVLPSTVSLFAGQHTWYSLSGGTKVDSDVPCEKCHADIAAEMEAVEGPHTGETGYDRMKCSYCHRVNWSDRSYAAHNDTQIIVGKKAHAASTVACMDCHSGVTQFEAMLGLSNHGMDPTPFSLQECKICHDDSGILPTMPEAAGGFDETGNTSDTGNMAAHLKFIKQAINSSEMEGANEACIACHTRIAVNISWEHAHDFEMTATWNTTGWDGGDEFPPTHFNVTDFGANGSVMTYSYGNNTTGKTSKWPGW